MSNVWVTADLHLEHEKAIEFRPEFSSVEAMNDELLYRWNQVVKPSDTVWVLGDVGLTGGDIHSKMRVVDWLYAANGRLVLVPGNHDNDWMFPLFDRVYGVVDRKGFLMSHIPVHTGQRERFKLNVHGHLHNNQIGDWVYQPAKLNVIENEDEHMPGTVWRPDPWYFCASVEQHEYAPVPWEHIVDHYRSNVR